MDRAVTGIFGMALAIWTALWVMFWKALGTILRFAWRRRRQIPHGHLALPALGIYAPL